MKILFAAPENAWGGFLGMLKSKIPDHDFEATGRFGVDNLAGSTDDSMQGIVAGVAENIGRIERGKEPLNAQ
jgi:hypothetical protein